MSIDFNNDKEQIFLAKCKKDFYNLSLGTLYFLKLMNGVKLDANIQYANRLILIDYYKTADGIGVYLNKMNDADFNINDMHYNFLYFDRNGKPMDDAYPGKFNDYFEIIWDFQTNSRPNLLTKIKSMNPFKTGGKTKPNHKTKYNITKSKHNRTHSKRK